MSKQTLFGVLAGIVGGVLFIAPTHDVLFGTLVANFTQLPLFLVGLSLGLTAAVIAAVVGSLIVGVATDMLYAVPFALAFAVPAVVFSRQTMLGRTMPNGKVEWYPTGRALAIVATYGLVMFGIAALLFGDNGESLIAAVEEVLATFGPDVPQSSRLESARELAAILPALAAMSWLITTVINAALAQVALVRLGKNTRPSLDLLNIELPLALAFAIAGGGALWLFTDGALALIGKTVMMTFGFLYMLQGLAVVHLVTRRWPSRAVALAAFYFTILVVLGWIGIALVGGLGLADQLIGLRRRFPGGGTDLEES